MKIKTIIIILLLNVNYVSSQIHYKHYKNSRIIKKSILPASLIGLGIIINKSNFEKSFQLKLRNKLGNDFHFPLDDYMQHAPITEMYIADLFSIKSKNHWFDQTKYLLISNIITFGITHTIKRTFIKKRPSGSSYSFPSGHTSYSFVNATILYNEFYKKSLVLAYSGYVFSGTTGAFRMANNKHWFSDVLLGAGIGMLVTNLVYYIEPFKNFNPLKKNKNISIIPQISNDNYGLYFQYKFY